MLSLTIVTPPIASVKERTADRSLHERSAGSMTKRRPAAPPQCARPGARSKAARKVNGENQEVRGPRPGATFPIAAADSSIS
jgi:hypothetical protein